MLPYAVPILKSTTFTAAASNTTPNVAVVVEKKVVSPESVAATISPEYQGDEQIQAHVLSVVSEKTGYPVEMLDLELGP